MKKIIVILSVFLLMVLGCATPDTTTQETTTIKVGVLGPFSGDAASYGESIKNGIEVGLEASGLDNIELVIEDSKCDGKEAVSAVNKLISLDGVQAIVGGVCSGGTLAAAPIAEQNQVPMVSPSSTSPDITDAGDYLFRVVPSDAFQGAFGAKLVYDKGYRKLGVLYSNEDYGVGFNKVLSENFAELGGEVVASEAHERTSVDLRAQITKVKEAGADAVYIISNSADSAVAAMKQIKELGLEVALFGSEGLKGDVITDNAGDTAEGLFVTSVSGGTQAFIDAHNAKFESNPGPFAAQGADAIQAIAWAIKLGASTGAEIKDNLYKVEFEGDSGSIKFDENGDVFGSYEVFVVKDGAFVAEE